MHVLFCVIACFFDVAGIIFSGTVYENGTSTEHMARTERSKCGLLRHA